MLTKIKPKSEFSKNVLTLMTGTTIAQAIPIAISPILTRIYTPEDFGVLALFVAITSIFGSIANGRYELAIMLPKKDENAINIFALGLIITFSMSFILLVLVVLFNEQITELLKNDEISVWLYFVPIAVLFIGLYNMLAYYNNRKKYYKELANATIIKSIFASIIQVSIGVFKGGVMGLISGQILSTIIANMRLSKNIINDKLLISNVTKIKIIALAKRYKNFPKFTMWATLANTLSYQLISILISAIYNISTLGSYSLVQKILGAPSSLIGASIGRVFFQTAIKEKQHTGKSINVFDDTTKKLFVIGLPFFGLFYLIVEEFFKFMFGKEWQIAGTYAKILIPFYFITFIFSQVSTIFSVFEKQKTALKLQIGLFTVSITTICCAKFFNFIFVDFLKVFVVAMFGYYVYFFYVCRRVATGQ